MKAILVIFSLFLSYALIVNAQELPNKDEPDSSFRVLFSYTFEAQARISDFRADVRKLETSVSTDGAENLFNRGGISDLTIYTLMAETAIINCKYFWSITVTWRKLDESRITSKKSTAELLAAAEFIATESMAVCDGITHNLSILDMCADLIKIQKELAIERDVIIQAHDTEQYLRKFAAKFRLLAADYGAYARRCAANAISKQEVKDSL